MPRPMSTYKADPLYTVRRISGQWKAVKANHRTVPFSQAWASLEDAQCRADQMNEKKTVWEKVQDGTATAAEANENAANLGRKKDYRGWPN